MLSSAPFFYSTLRDTWSPTNTDITEENRGCVVYYIHIFKIIVKQKNTFIVNRKSAQSTRGK